jgi:hypothetical protein
LSVTIPVFIFFALAARRKKMGCGYNRKEKGAGRKKAKK